MVKQISDKKIMTINEAREKYKNNYFGFITTEQNVTNPNNSLGYVVCVMDSYDEGYSFPRRTDEGFFISVLTGYAVGGTEIGAIIFEGV